MGKDERKETKGASCKAGRVDGLELRIDSKDCWSRFTGGDELKR